MAALLTVLLAIPAVAQAGRLTQLVNPYIGTGGHGHVFLGANVPFGLVQLGPTQYTHGWDWCSGYHYSDSVVVGFSHMHLSGTGIGDLGDVTLLPTTTAAAHEARFSHRAEHVRPGYYAVTLDNGVHVELAATERAGMHRYTWPADADSNIVRLDLKRGIGWDRMTEGAVRQENATTISGRRLSRGWANDQRVYFVAEFSKQIKSLTVSGDTLATLTFEADGQPLTVRVGLSAVGTDGARENLRAEMDHWDLRRVVREADEKWERQLEKVSVSGALGADELTIFYTALYHTMTAPSLFSDVSGDYRGADGKMHHGSHQSYTTFSLWDTYRAAHPLMTLIHRDRQADIAATMLQIFNEQGKLPVWHLMGCETDCMVGNPGVPVLADLVLKHLTDKHEEAFVAMKTSSMLDERGMAQLKAYGYIPNDLLEEQETVGRAMEYAIADWCVARVAQRLGKKAEQRYFDRRAQAYRLYFDQSTGFMRSKDSKGNFRSPFSPFDSAPTNRDYTEGNAWQYTWLVPHDPHGLIGLFGGETAFTTKLDSLFVVDSKLGEDAPPDISGLIGQYAHGNEPSHHVLYLYNYAGQPWKGARLLRRTMEELYHNAPDGLSGNEDVGQMSAWYVLSALGLYQVEPAGGKYVIGTPLFGEATIDVGEGRTFTIKATNNSRENCYVQRALLNGKTYSRSYVMYDDIVGGGVLELVMGSEPSDFGSKVKDRP